MLCLRCGGLMVPDQCEDLLEVSGPVRTEIWRCTCCGDIEDPLILKNRPQRESLDW